MRPTWGPRGSRGSEVAGKSATRQSWWERWSTGTTEREHSASRLLEGITFDHDLGPFVHQTIDPKRATVRTDGLTSYRPLPAAGFHHDRQIEGHRRNAKEILPWIHLVFTNLKAWIRGAFHGVSKKHMQRYLDEFVFRFDRRVNEYGLLRALLNRVARSEPCPYARLTAETIG